MKISQNTSVINISFWGVVLGELVSLAHTLGFDGTRHSYGMKFGNILRICGQIPEQIGDGISFVFGSILLIYLMEALCRQKLYLFKSISSLIAIDGLGYILGSFAEGDDIGVLGATFGAMFGILAFGCYLVIAGYLCAVFVSKTTNLRTAGFLLGAIVLMCGIQLALSFTGNGDYASFIINLITSALYISFYYQIKEECNYWLEDETVEINTLHYAQIGYAALIVLMLMFFVVL